MSNQCENPECDNEVTPQAGAGRPRSNCSVKCAKRGRKVRINTDQQAGRVGPTITKILWKSRERATTKGMEYDLTREFLTGLYEGQDARCAKTGVEFVNGKWEGEGTGNPYGVSVDRIDSSRGYTQDNVQLVCWLYNRAKGNWPEELVDKFFTQQETHDE